MSERREKDGWIEWSGGECPVPDGTLVDVRHRDGEEYDNQPAGFFNDEYQKDFKGAACDWSIDQECKDDGDIVAYRVVSA